MRRKIGSILLASIVTLLFLGMMLPVKAAPNLTSPLQPASVSSAGEYECESFDVLFLIDQSRSMKDNDPRNQRIDAVKWAIRNIAYQSFQTCTNDPMFRLAVRPFGGTLDEDFIPFTNINPNNDAELNAFLDDVFPLLNPKDLDNTDFKLAFDAAYEMFDDLSYSTGIENEKAVILLTDGTACSIEMQEAGQCSSSNSIQVYMNELKEQLIMDFPPTEYHLYVVGINRYRALPVEHQSFYSKNAIEPWTKIATKYLLGSEYIQLGDSSSEIPVIFTKFIEELTGINGIDISCGPFPVDPYLESVQFNIFRNTEDSPAVITVRNSDNEESIYQGGKLIDGVALKPEQEPVYNTDGLLNETYTFINPVPGMWGVTMTDFTACEELKGTVIPIFSTSEKVSPVQGLPQFPDESPEYDEEDRYYLQYKIIDRAGEKLPSYGGDFDIKATVEITSPSGLLYMRQLIYDPTSDLWTIDKPLPTNELGTYTYTLIGKAPSVEKDKEITLIDDQATYEVAYPVERFSWHIDKSAIPDTSATKSGFGCQTEPNASPVDIYVTEYGAPGVSVDTLKPINAIPIFKSEDVFILEIRNSENAFIDSLPLRYIGSEADPGHFSVKIPGTLLLEPDTYQLKVVLPDKAINTGWGQRITEGEHDVVLVTRVEEWVTTEMACNAQQSSLVLFVFILMAYVIYSVTGKPKGFLHFEGPGGDEITSPISVTGAFRKSVLGKNRLGTVSAYVELNKIVVRRSGTAKDHNSEDDAQIQITMYGVEDGRKVTFVEKEIVKDQDAIYLPNNVSVTYTRRGVKK